MHKPLLVAICQFVCLNHHEKRKLTPDYDEGSLKANDLHFDPKKRYKGTKVQSNKLWNFLPILGVLWKFTIFLLHNYHLVNDYQGKQNTKTKMNIIIPLQNSGPQAQRTGNK